MMKKISNVYDIGYLTYIILVCTLYVLTITHALPDIFIHLPLILAFIPISYKALQRLRAKKIGTEFFLTIATIISLIGHQEKAMNIVLLIMLIAEYLEHLIEERTNKEIRSLINLIPKVALIKINNIEEKIIPISELTPGTLVIIKTGERIPVDGLITHGEATINEASLTGESLPLKRTLSQRVYAGTFLESGTIIVKTEKVGADTFFGKISALIETTEKKAKISILTDKIALYLVPTILIFIGITWLLTKNLNLVTTLLVFGSPLELTVITPLAILSGIIAAFRNGILVKGGLVLEKLSHADTIIFDKTGTLTIGEPVVIKIEILNNKYNENELLKIAAIAEKRSDHVLAKAVLKKAHTEGIVVPDPEQYVSVSGHGVEILYNNEKIFLGNKHFITATEHGNIHIPDTLEEKELEHSSSFYIGGSQTLYGKIYITDTLRSEAKETINDLKKMGIANIILLSGDKQSIATYVAAQLGIPEAHGEVAPDQKLHIIERLQQSHTVAMVGDGINDAPALRQADIGIAMGAMGMEPAIEAADIVLITNNIHHVVFLYALSKKIFKVIQQNLLVGFALIHGLGLIFTFLGFIDPLKAALFHAVSDLAILINSARLINFTLKK